MADKPTFEEICAALSDNRTEAQKEADRLLSIQVDEKIKKVGLGRHSDIGRTIMAEAKKAQDERDGFRGIDPKALEETLSRLVRIVSAQPGRMTDSPFRTARIA